MPTSYWNRSLSFMSQRLAPRELAPWFSLGLKWSWLALLWLQPALQQPWMMQCSWSYRLDELSQAKPSLLEPESRGPEVSAVSTGTVQQFLCLNFHVSVEDRGTWLLRALHVTAQGKEGALQSELKNCGSSSSCSGARGRGLTCQQRFCM